jgi:D-alanyl-D-alanine carboxypeptidase (penicillin-binding protein 5/6)
MKLLTAGRARLYSLLLFVFVVAVMVWALVGPAQGAGTTTTLPVESTQESSFTVSAQDLGRFAVEPPTIKSPSAIVINMTTGKVLYEHNADVQRPMASTTKIMTGILILERMDLGAEVVVSAAAAATSETVPWLKKGDVLTVEKLLYALLVRSSNSAAVALAEACSGSLEAFVAEMNKKGDELGMDDTNFVHPSGLDRSGHHSTAADMAVLARYAMQNAKFREIVSTEEYKITVPGRDVSIVCESTNKLLGAVDWVTGIKTGLTPKADQCLVASGTKDGVNVISVVLGQPVPDVCWAESKALMEYGFSQYRFVTLIDKGVAVAEAAVPYRLDGRLELLTASAVDMELYKDDAVTTSIELEKPLTLPVAAGDVFGHVVLTVEGDVVDTVDLVAAKSYGQTSLGSKIAYFWRRLGRVLGRVL